MNTIKLIVTLNNYSYAKHSPQPPPLAGIVSKKLIVIVSSIPAMFAMHLLMLGYFVVCFTPVIINIF